MFNLFVNNASEHFIVSSKKLKCATCEKSLNSFAILKQYYYTEKNQPTYKNFVFCTNICGKEHKFINTHSKVILCYISDSVESDFIAVFPNLSMSDGKNRNETTFSAVDLPSEKVVDKAWRSREYPSLEGAQVGLLPEEVDSKNKELSLDDGFKLLDDLKNSKIERPKQLESDKDE